MISNLYYLGIDNEGLLSKALYDYYIKILFV